MYRNKEHNGFYYFDQTVYNFDISHEFQQVTSFLACQDLTGTNATMFEDTVPNIAVSRYVRVTKFILRLFVNQVEGRIVAPDGDGTRPMEPFMLFFDLFLVRGATSTDNPYYVSTETNRIFPGVMTGYDKTDTRFTFLKRVSFLFNPAVYVTGTSKMYFSGEPYKEVELDCNFLMPRSGGFGTLEDGYNILCFGCTTRRLISGNSESCKVRWSQYIEYEIV